MAIRLEKGQRINLEKSNGSKLTEFLFRSDKGCNKRLGFLCLSENPVQSHCLFFPPVSKVWFCRSPTYVPAVRDARNILLLSL